MVDPRSDEQEVFPLSEKEREGQPGQVSQWKTPRGDCVVRIIPSPTDSTYTKPYDTKHPTAEW